MLNKVLHYVEPFIFIGQGLIGVLGIFLVILVTRKIRQKKFKNQAASDDFLSQVRELLQARDYDGVTSLCDSPGYWAKAVPQLILIAMQHRFLTIPKMKVLLTEKFEREVLAELSYQAEVAEWVGADTINIHGGGAYGDKAAALRVLRENITRLPQPVRSRLTLENDDKVYTPADLLPVCADTGVPLVYDVHHHRCLPDGLSVAEATTQARKTWKSEPLFHISSPIEGWNGPKPERHHDYINASDFPQEWLGWPLTVEVEAKAKELAVARLLAELALI